MADNQNQSPVIEPRHIAALIKEGGMDFMEVMSKLTDAEKKAFQKSGLMNDPEIMPIHAQPVLPLGGLASFAARTAGAGEGALSFLKGVWNQAAPIAGGAAGGYVGNKSGHPILGWALGTTLGGKTRFPTKSGPAGAPPAPTPRGQKPAASVSTPMGTAGDIRGRKVDPHPNLSQQSSTEAVKSGQGPSGGARGVRVSGGEVSSAPPGKPSKSQGFQEVPPGAKSNKTPPTQYKEALADEAESVYNDPKAVEEVRRRIQEMLGPQKSSTVEEAERLIQEIMKGKTGGNLPNNARRGAVLKTPKKK